MEAVNDGRQPFDPKPYLREIRSKGGPALYLDVKYRILWFRTEHPDGTITSDLVSHDAQAKLAIFRATVSWPGGGSATDYGSETQTDFPDYIEKASTKAIGRALAALGYGTQFATDHEMENTDGTPHVVDAPIDIYRTRERRVSNPEQTGATPATARQVKFFYALAHEAGIDDASLVARLREKYGVENADMLTRGQISEAIESMQKRRDAAHADA